MNDSLTHLPSRTGCLPAALQARLDALCEEAQVLPHLADDPNCSDNEWLEQAEKVYACLQAMDATARQVREEQEARAA